MARSKTKKVPMRSRKSGLKKQKLINHNNQILKKYKSDKAT